MTTSDLASSKSRRRSGWVAIRVREREVRRQLLYNSLRKRLAGSLSASPLGSGDGSAIAAEYLKLLLTSTAAFWLISYAVHLAFGANLIVIYALLGMVYALQSSYYSYRLHRDPNFKIPRCACSKASPLENSERVLKSATGFFHRVPIGVPAVLFYVVLLTPWAREYDAAVLFFTTAACLVTLGLGYLMVFRIRSLCSNCIYLGALNLLILFENL